MIALVRKELSYVPLNIRVTTFVTLLLVELRNAIAIVCQRHCRGQGNIGVEWKSEFSAEHQERW